MAHGHNPAKVQNSNIRHDGILSIGNFMLMINNHFAQFQLPGSLLKTKKCASYFRGNTQFPIFFKMEVGMEQMLSISLYQQRLLPNLLSYRSHIVCRQSIDKTKFLAISKYEKRSSITKQIDDTFDGISMNDCRKLIQPCGMLFIVLRAYTENGNGFVVIDKTFNACCGGDTSATLKPSHAWAGACDPLMTPYTLALGASLLVR
jgi:hypothetical protein